MNQYRFREDRSKTNNIRDKKDETEQAKKIRGG